MKNNIYLFLYLSPYIWCYLSKYTKKYKRKYLGWLQGETRKLHKISEDKNLTESVHRKISHGVRNSLAVSCVFAWCSKFRTTMRKCWLLDFFLWFSSLHIFDWLGKRLWSATKLGFFIYLSFNLHCHGFHKILPHSWLVSMIK